jgi:cyanamide hydratase
MTDSVKNQELAAHGWTAVPRSQSKIIAELEEPKPADIDVNEIRVPDSEVARKTYEYAKRELPEKTFNHSMRVYYYGKSWLFLFIP